MTGSSYLVSELTGLLHVPSSEVTAVMSLETIDETIECTV